MCVCVCVCKMCIYFFPDFKHVDMMYINISSAIFIEKESKKKSPFVLTQPTYRQVGIQCIADLKSTFFFF